ncbi:hypothetical protein GCM10027586_20170 [Kineococcus gypseus]
MPVMVRRGAGAVVAGDIRLSFGVVVSIYPIAVRVSDNLSMLTLLGWAVESGPCRYVLLDLNIAPTPDVVMVAVPVAEQAQALRRARPQHAVQASCRDAT